MIDHQSAPYAAPIVEALLGGGAHSCGLVGGRFNVTGSSAAQAPTL